MAKTKGGTISWQNKSEKIHRAKLRSLIAGPENNLYPSEQTKDRGGRGIHAFTDIPIYVLRHFVQKEDL